MSLQKLSITNRYNLKLSALFRKTPSGKFTGPGSSKLGLEGQDMPPLIVVCHGFSGNKESGGTAVAMANELAPLGFDTLLFDFTGCGESEGPWEEITLSRQIEDLGSVVDWVRSRGYRRIILNGRSFGGATVLAYAAVDRQIDAVCTWAAVARPFELFGGFIGKEVKLDGPADEKIKLPAGGGSAYLRRRFFQDLQGYNLPECAARIAPRPLLLFHGTADKVVPISDAHLLFDAAAEPKELAVIEGADHGFSEHREQVWERFFRWLGTLKGCDDE